MAEKVSTLGTLRALEPGESASFPIDKVFQVRSLVSTINLQRGEKSLSTKSDRESGTITATRLA